MGLNFGQMQQQVVDRINPQYAGDANFLRRVKAFLNASNRSISVMRFWPWLVGPGSASLTATTTTVSLAATVRNVFHVWLDSDGTVLTHSPFQREQINQGSLAQLGRSRPEQWCQLGSTLVVIPYPAGADTLRFLYYAHVVDMVADADEPLMPDNHRQILVEDACAKLMAGESFDAGMAKMAWATRNELLRALMHTSVLASPQPSEYMMLRRNVFGGGQL